MLGLEPPTSGVNERIVRLCGVRSDVTPLSVGKHQPFLPPLFTVFSFKAAIVLPRQARDKHQKTLKQCGVSPQLERYGEHILPVVETIPLDGVENAFLEPF